MINVYSISILLSFQYLIIIKCGGFPILLLLSDPMYIGSFKTGSSIYAPLKKINYAFEYNSILCIIAVFMGQIYENIEKLHTWCNKIIFAKWQLLGERFKGSTNEITRLNKRVIQFHI